MRGRLVRALALPLAVALLLVLPGMAADSRSALPEVVAAPMVFDAPLPAGPPVDPEWFDRAVFIGDARAHDLAQSGAIPFGLWLTEDGLNLRSLRDGGTFLVAGQRLTLDQILPDSGYDKIYLMLGLNEAAWMDEATFGQELSGLIGDLRGLLPGAEIYLQTLIPVTVVRAAARTPDNVLLARRSALLERLAREERVFLIDAAAPFTAPSGALTSSLSDDGLHLNAAGNALLAQCLRCRAVED